MLNACIKPLCFLVSYIDTLSLDRLESASKGVYRSISMLFAKLFGNV